MRQPPRRRRTQRSARRRRRRGGGVYLLGAVALAAVVGGPTILDTAEQAGSVAAAPVQADRAPTTTTTKQKPSRISTPTQPPATAEAHWPVVPLPPDIPEAATAIAVYYKNCDAARAAGVAPILRGEPGYRPPLDRDGDGVACEPKPR